MYGISLLCACVRACTTPCVYGARSPGTEIIVLSHPVGAGSWVQVPLEQQSERQPLSWLWSQCRFSWKHWTPFCNAHRFRSISKNMCFLKFKLQIEILYDMSSETWHIVKAFDSWCFSSTTINIRRIHCICGSNGRWLSSMRGSHRRGDSCSWLTERRNFSQQQLLASALVASVSPQCVWSMHLWALCAVSRSTESFPAVRWRLCTDSAFEKYEVNIWEKNV